MSATPKNRPKQPRRTYSQDVILEAIQAVKGGMTVTAAAKNFGIPRQTLKDKLSGKYAVGCAMGRPSVFTPDEEKIIVDWIISSGRAGFPITKDALLMSVKKLSQNLQRKTPFTDAMPGERWYTLFMNRHPEIAGRMSQALTTSRANVTEEDIRDWFAKVKTYVESKNLMDVFSDKSRVFNCDETAFFLCPKDKKVLVKRGERHVYSITGNDEKECLTALITASANGTMAPPMVVFSYERIPCSIVKKYPEGWGIGKTENGWMTSESFYEYVSNVFEPWLQKNQIKRPVILFVDGHSSHITYHLSEFCSSKEIELIALYPNSTHVLQPLDVALFHPLKACWRKIVQHWRFENGATRIKKEDFAPLLKQCLEESVKEKTLENGFATTGLSTLNPEDVDFKKIIKSKPRLEAKTPFSHSQWLALRGHLDYIETKIGEGKLEMFKKKQVQRRDESLYDLWMATKAEITKYREALEEKSSNKSETVETPAPSEDDQATDSQEEVLENEVQIVAIAQNDQDQEDLLNITGIEDFQMIELDLPSTSTGPSVCLGVSLSDLDQMFRTPSKSPDLQNSNSIEKQIDKIMTSTPVSTRKEIPMTTIETIQTPAELKNKVPSPFKNALFWPGESKNPKKLTKKVRLPSAITSDEWKQFYLKKEEEKKAADMERERKKQLREANLRIKKEKVEKSAKRKLRELEDQEEDVDDLEEDLGVERLLPPPLELNTEKLVPGQWVVVPYSFGSETKTYVGQILNVDNESRKIHTKFLTKKIESEKFIWPKQDDIDDVPFSEVVQILREPTFDRWGYLYFEDFQF